MTKKKAKKQMSKTHKTSSKKTWIDNEGIHVQALFNNEGPTEQQLEEMTKEYQNEIRKSPIWKDLTKEHEIDKAEAILKAFRIKVK